MSRLLKAVSSTKTLSHFTHDRHPLRVVPNEYEFMCDGCNTPGAGERYHCKECLFDLHNECAMSPPNLSSHIHPIHSLVRTWDQPADVAAVSLGNNRPCNVCGEQVNGLFFTCPVLSCNFFLHPICSKFPQYVNHAIDRQHHLTFQYANESACNICGHNCMGWRYRCETCRIDIHLECLLLPPPTTNNNLGMLNLERNGSSTKHRRPLHHRPQHGAGSTPPCGLNHHHSFNNHNQGGDGSTGGSASGSRRKKMYAIVGQILAAVVVQTIIGIPSMIGSMT